MGVADTKRELAANRMIFEVRRDPALAQGVNLWRGEVVCEVW